MTHYSSELLFSCCVILVHMQIDEEVAKLKGLKLRLKEDGNDEQEAGKKFVLKCPKVC